MQTDSKLKKAMLIHHMVIHKIKLDYSDQLFGYLWALINPIVLIFSYWFFAYVGLRGGTIGEIPYICWIVPGVLVYRFLSSVLSASSTMLIKNAGLIKGSNIDIRYYPLIETLKEAYVHIVVMIVMFGLYAILGYTMTGSWEYLPTVYYINFAYYWIVLFVYVNLIGYIFSALGILFRDTKNIIKAILTPLFWMTPVLYPVENGINPMLEKIEMIVNPFYYFIHGYRETMVYGTFFYTDTLYNVYMWIVMLIMLLFARKIWKFVYPIAADLV